MSPRIAAVLSSSLRLATLHELQTVYGTEDLWDLLEIIVIEGHNRRLASEQRD